MPGLKSQAGILGMMIAPLIQPEVQIRAVLGSLDKSGIYGEDIVTLYDVVCSGETGFFLTAAKFLVEDQAGVRQALEKKEALDFYKARSDVVGRRLAEMFGGTTREKPPQKSREGSPPTEPNVSTPNPNSRWANPPESKPEQGPVGKPRSRRPTKSSPWSRNP
ncbi:MAG: hypothetical protein AAF569_04525 [Pseudomonadota bacterium]